MRNGGNFSGTKMAQRQHVDKDAEEKVKSLVGSILFSFPYQGSCVTTRFEGRAGFEASKKGCAHGEGFCVE